MGWWVELATSGFAGLLAAGLIGVMALAAVIFVLALVLRAFGRPGLWEASISGYREGRDRHLDEIREQRQPKDY